VTPPATGEPTNQPTDQPSQPTDQPSQPTGQPSSAPSSQPTEIEDLPVPSGPGKGRLTTLRGTVSPGVERGCLLLTTDRGVFQLLGAARAQLRPGMTVEVDGAPDDQLSTTCQQGTPFLVAAVRTS
jgi:hypothetical protein